MLIIVLIVSITISCCYAGLILFFTFGWFRIRTQSTGNVAPETNVSVIIAFRNEEENVKQLLICLAEQNYPANLLDVILVDDHSEDKGPDIVREFISEKGCHNFHLLSLDDADGFSKKAALKKGIQNSAGKLIITTDADCTFGKNWVNSLVEYYEQEKCRLISGPVVFENKKGVFHKLQSLEFMSLIASGAGAIGMDKPILANGANLCFERSLYSELSTISQYEHIASGDDIFLLLETKKHINKPGTICFLKSEDAVATTKSARNLKEFVNQRVRWASKSSSYSDLFAIFTTLIVGLFSVSILIFLGFSAIKKWFTVLSIAMLLLKLTIDFPLMYSISAFFRRKKLLWYYIPMQFFYPFYVITVAVLSVFMKFEWKGRKRRK